MIDKRRSERRLIEPLEISSITTIDGKSLIANFATIVEASTTGLLLNVTRKDLIPKYLRENLSLETIEGDRIKIYLSQMNLEISGFITRTKFLGKKGFEISIDYSEDEPDYWRECLIDLLPAPGEFNEQ